jgi:hypothetical protein
MRKVIIIRFDFNVLIDLYRGQIVNRAKSVNSQTRTSVDPPPSQEEEKEINP